MSMIQSIVWPEKIIRKLKSPCHLESTFAVVLV